MSNHKKQPLPRISHVPGDSTQLALDSLLEALQLNVDPVGDHTLKHAKAALAMAYYAIQAESRAESLYQHCDHEAEKKQDELAWEYATAAAVAARHSAEEEAAARREGGVAS